MEVEKRGLQRFIWERVLKKRYEDVYLLSRRQMKTLFPEANTIKFKTTLLPEVIISLFQKPESEIKSSACEIYGQPRKVAVGWPCDYTRSRRHYKVFRKYRQLINFYKKTMHFRFPQRALREQREHSVRLCVLCVSMVKPDGL